MALPTITLIGNLTADPELRWTQSGKPVTSLRMACNERKKNEAGEWVDGDTLFMNVTVWRNAQAVSDALKKGSPIIVYGTLKQDNVDKDGVKTSYFKVNADDVALQLFDKAGQVTGTQSVTQTGDGWSGWASPATASVDDDDRRKYGNTF